MMELIAEYDGMAGMIACVVMVYHLIKCERRSDRIFPVLNDLRERVAKIEGKLEEKS